MRRYLVHLEPGPAWVDGLSLREQPQWHEHADYMDRLCASGRIELGGPYAEPGASEAERIAAHRALLVVAAAGPDEVRTLLAADPWLVEPVLRIAHLLEWTVLLDSLAGTHR